MTILLNSFPNSNSCDLTVGSSILEIVFTKFKTKILVPYLLYNSSKWTSVFRKLGSIFGYVLILGFGFIVVFSFPQNIGTDPKIN